MSNEARPYIGGQAVLEGVMMRAPCGVSVAVRRPDGTIAVKEGPLKSKLAGSKLLRLPLIRGVAMLVESLSLGYGALRFSADQIMPPEEREKGGNSGGAVWLSMLIAIALFIGTPQGLATFVIALFKWNLTVQDPRFHLLVGAFKLTVFISYLTLVSRIEEMRRVFQYHGAEHKTIYAYEAGLPLTVENVRAQSTLHPRCGTTFLVVVILVSILVGSAVTPLVLPHASGWVGQIQTFLLRVALLPVIAAISYELQRFTAKFCTVGPLRVLLWPGFLFQKITTREPDDTQIEIAIAAMQAAMWRETAGKEVPADDTPLVFPTFAAFSGAVANLRGGSVTAAA